MTLKKKSIKIMLDSIKLTIKRYGSKLFTYKREILYCVVVLNLATNLYLLQHRSVRIG